MATIKQKQAIKEIVENGRSVSAAMRAAGYSPKTAVDPSKLTNSKGWKELVKYIPDDLLLKTTLEGLNASKWILPHDEPSFETADHATRHKFLETGLKLKRYITNDKEDHTQPITINIVKFTQNGLDTIEVHTSGLPAGNT